MKRAALSLTLLAGLSVPVLADAPLQLGQIGGAVKRAQQVRDLHVTRSRRAASSAPR